VSRRRILRERRQDESPPKRPRCADRGAAGDESKLGEKTATVGRLVHGSGSWVRWKESDDSRSSAAAMISNGFPADDNPKRHSARL
jgi:hypothetical protein